MLHTDSSASFSPYALVLALLLMGSLVGMTRRKASLRYPPGPHSLPLIGNMFDMPRADLGRSFAELSARYGDMVYLNVLGQHMLVLDSYEAADEILEKRSATTSDRPESPMLRLCGLEWFFALMPYGHAWRKRRRAFYQSFNPQAITEYQSIQISAVQRLVHSLLVSPKDLNKHLGFTVAAIGLHVAYGIELRDIQDEAFTMIQRLVAILADIAIPGKYIVESIPILQHLPSWVPGASFKTYAAAAKSELESILAKLRAISAEQMKKVATAGVTVSCVLQNGITKAHSDQSAEAEEVLKSTAASAYLAGVETTNTIAQAFFLSMALYPRVQKKAQEELDAVVGSYRLPTFADMESLPYLNTLVKELFRWHIPVPLGLPHSTTSDEEYKGYFIPKGTLVLSNVWSLSRNPKEYPDPGDFIPERFLVEEGRQVPRDPHQFVFGYGRRICPGRHFAEATIAMLCATVLHVFDIRPPLDENGRSQKIEYKVTNDTAVSHPVVYDYAITPRSPGAEKLIISMDAAAGRSD